MLKTSFVSKVMLANLPSEALELVSMGRYTLYRAISSSAPDIAYALRVSADEVFALDSDGTPLDYNDLSGIEITGKVEIEDVPAPFVLSNFSFA